MTDLSTPPRRSGTRLEFADLTDYPVMAQALDNQWLPPALAERRRTASPTAGAIPDQVSAASAELRRSLVNSGTLVVNRAYFLNNRALYTNYLPEADPAERGALLHLLNQRALVPYLLGERDPAERPAFTLDNHVYQSWRHLVTDESEPACVRLSWDDEQNHAEAARIGRRFTQRLQGLRWLDPGQLGKDLGIPGEQARAMCDGILRRILQWAGEQPGDGPILRNAVYENFITRPGTGPHQQLLRDEEHVVPAKQLIDLVYNIGVPAAGGIVAVTPPQSPPRSALQELEVQGRNPVEDPEALGRMVRDVLADAVHRAVDGPNSYGGLSLADVVRLRQEEAWRTYIDALGSLGSGFDAGRVPEPEAFAHATADIAEKHARMLKEARRISRGGSGYAREIGLMLVLESPGIALQIVAGEGSLQTGVLQAVSAAAGPLVMRMVFKDRRPGPQGDLSHSITLPTMRLRSLRKDWEAILGEYAHRPDPAAGALPPRHADQQTLTE
ncbi:hypothetical protein [Streptomyces sp. KR80]|uniref:hypothetical protein n=1 Tax=Streptomyces sp. KR80 TaxID=3457426 RepID=UPI003FD50821